MVAINIHINAACYARSLPESYLLDCCQPAYRAAEVITDSRYQHQQHDTFASTTGLRLQDHHAYNACQLSTSYLQQINLPTLDGDMQTCTSMSNAMTLGRSLVTHVNVHVTAACHACRYPEDDLWTAVQQEVLLTLLRGKSVSLQAVNRWRYGWEPLWLTASCHAITGALTVMFA